MRLTVVRNARFNWSNLFGRKSKAETGEDANTESMFDSVDADDNARNERKPFALSVPPYATKVDVLRARGFLPHNKHYEPPADLESKLAEIIEKLATTETNKSDSAALTHFDWKAVDFSQDIDRKFKILTACERNFGKRVRNADLHEINTGLDVLRYYSAQESLTAPYNRLARGQDNSAEQPKNLHIIEECIRYDPARDGPTAFPKSQGRSHNIKYSRMYEAIKCPSEWHEFQMMKYRTPQAPESAPWRPETAVKNDSVQWRRPKFMP